MYRKKGGSILIISHQERILNIADRIIVISGGKIEADGPKADILPGLLTGGVCSVLAGKM